MLSVNTNVGAMAALQFLNQTQIQLQATQSHINVFDGLVMLMPKKKPYLLRNIGKQSLTLLLIEVRN